jgi:sugar phosphate permease
VTVGKGLALIGGGFILQQLQGQALVALPFGLMLRPWQVVFVAAGAPGLVLAPLILFTLREPARRRITLDAQGERIEVSFHRLFEFVRENKGAVAAHAFGYSIWSLNERALGFWAPTYLQRAFHMPTSQAGYAFGTISVAVSLIASFCVGWLVDRATKAGQTDAPLRIGRNGAALSVIPIFAFPFMPNAPTAIAVLTVGLICASAYSTVTVAQQQLAPNQARAQYTGFYLLVSNLIGGILGPSLVAVVTEQVLHDHNAIGVSIALVCAGSAVIGALILTFGLKPYAESMTRIGRSTAPRAAG